MGEIIFFMFIGMFIGVFALSYLINQGIKELEKRNEQFVDGAIKIWKDHMIVLKIEKVKDLFYAYNDATDDFVCQGANFDELQSNFQKRFPDNGSYIKQEYLHFFPEEVKRAMKSQKRMPNLDNTKNDIVIIDDESNKS